MALILSVSILRKCSINSFGFSVSLKMSLYSTFLEVTFVMIGSHLMNMCSWSSFLHFKTLFRTKSPIYFTVSKIQDNNFRYQGEVCASSMVIPSLGFVFILLLAILPTSGESTDKPSNFDCIALTIVGTHLCRQTLI